MLKGVMKTGSAAFLLLICLVGKQFAQEVLVPLDAGGKLESITADMEKSMGVFPEYANLTKVMLFQLSENSYILEVFYKEDGKTKKKRIEMTAEETLKLRSRITERYESSGLKRASGDYLNPDGKVSLLLFSTAIGFTYGLGTYFFFVDTNTNGSFTLGMASFLLGGAGGFCIPFFTTLNRPVSLAQSTMYTYGATLGFIHGLCLNYIIFGTNWMSSATVFWGLPNTLSIVESIGCYLLVDILKMHGGTATLIFDTSYYAGAMALGGLFVSGVMDNMSNNNSVGTIIGTTILLSSIAGGIGGYFLNNLDTYTPGDSLIIGQMLVLGTLSGFMVASYLPFQTNLVNGMKVWAGSVMGGTMLAYLGGFFLVKDRDFTLEQAGLTTLGTFAGGLVGAGVALIFQPDSNNAARAYFTAATLGSVLGFGLMYVFNQGQALKSAEEHNTAFHFHFAPESLALAFYREVYDRSMVVPETLVLQASFEF